MTAPPAGALEACLALLEKATRGRWSQDTGGDITMDDGTTLFTRELPGGDSDISFANANLVEAAINLLKDHGPALLAALRLREGCEGLVVRIEREADAHTYFADNADLRMTASDHAKRAAQLTTIRDDLAPRPGGNEMTDKTECRICGELTPACELKFNGGICDECDNGLVMDDDQSWGAHENG